MECKRTTAFLVTIGLVVPVAEKAVFVDTSTRPAPKREVAGALDIGHLAPVVSIKQASGPARPAAVELPSYPRERFSAVLKPPTREPRPDNTA